MEKVVQPDPSSRALLQAEPNHRRAFFKRAGIGCVIVAALLGIGVVAGYLIGKSSSGHVNSPTSGSSHAADLLQQLPPPGSSSAAQLLADPDTPQYVRDIYQAHNDTAGIDPNTAAAFLTKLRYRLQQLGHPADLSLFIDLANSAVDLFRVLRAEALLTLLRQYSSSGALALEHVDLDQLQREVDIVLQPRVLDRFFHYTSVRSTHDDPNIRRDWLSIMRATHQPAAVERSLLPQSQSPAPLQRRVQPQGPRRRLSADASIPVIRDGASRQLATASPPQTLKDMLCAIAPYAGAPTNIAGCRPRPTGRFSSNGITFQPVTIPVVFHCMRFRDAKGMLQPPYWTPVRDASHLIEATNALYQGTGIAFKLKEIRTDPVRYPYLLMDSTADWQNCAAGPNSAADGFSCLRGVARNYGDASLAINVIVVGSVYSPAFCDLSDSSAVCNGLYLGFSETSGPWMANPSPSWTEDNRGGNWITVTWDYISADYSNNDAKWDGGAATLAHELGHYLGLRHTHEGGCAGDGVNVADAVPDTPQNKDIQVYAANRGITRLLAQFCTNWRNGAPYDVKVLQQFNSCQGRPDVVDNVFNILSYLPDSCVMIFTENQVARMQWAVATFRPQLMARYAN